MANAMQSVGKTPDGMENACGTVEGQAWKVEQGSSSKHGNSSKQARMEGQYMYQCGSVFISNRCDPFAPSTRLTPPLCLRLRLLFAQVHALKGPRTSTRDSGLMMSKYCSLPVCKRLHSCSTYCTQSTYCSLFVCLVEGGRKAVAYGVLGVSTCSLSFLSI